ncbi:restriction endonuclease subunit S [Lactobacillus delbrueckii]|uniref:restriction endonuclease subunit S n=1 Tax=Lactobacillus delbrueckii TaxID=1584 RepID=UPI001E518D17|nr:restriction endonuclease subunit S [Lactobacillus delbrueckii]MCD5534687.1 restriction endonuclease subunit S [Lactobacillus delbrueckii subsp. sunkii]
MKDEKKAPKLRFKGFTDDWEQCKLGDVCVITMGQSPNSNNYTDNPKDHILVQGNADMKDGQVYPRIWTTETTKTAKKGDLILTVRAPVGDVGKTGYDVVIGRGVAAIQGNEFIFQLLNRMKATGYWTKYSTGSTFESINSSEINNAVMHLPKKHEQIVIGNVLSYLDQTITLHEEKKRKLEQLKKGLLQKMFADETGYPVLRFKGFTEKLEQRKLGEITDVRDGTHDSPHYVDEGYPLITSKNVSNGRINYDAVNYISEYDFNQINERSKVNINDILMGMIGTIGNLALIREDPNFAIKNVALIKYTESINHQFLFQNLQTSYISKQLSNSMDGGTQKFISLKKIRNLSIKFPILNEQFEIGQFFQSLDKTIILHDKKIQYLKQLKRGVLQKMFI